MPATVRSQASERWWADREAMALMLFTGRAVLNKRGLPRTEFLSDKTNPTCEEATEALHLVLAVGRISPDLARALSGAFDPRAAWPPIKVRGLVRRTKGHP